MSIELASQISISVSRSASTIPSVRSTTTEKRNTIDSPRAEYHADATKSKVAKEITEQKVENSTKEADLSAAKLVNQVSTDKSNFPAGQLENQQNTQESKVDIRETVSQLNEFVQNLRREIHFSIDEESGRSIVKVIDPETDKVIRQFPPEEILAMAEKIEHSNQGVLIKEKA